MSQVPLYAVPHTVVDHRMTKMSVNAHAKSTRQRGGGLLRTACAWEALLHGDRRIDRRQAVTRLPHRPVVYAKIWSQHAAHKHDATHTQLSATASRQQGLSPYLYGPARLTVLFVLNGLSRSRQHLAQLRYPPSPPRCNPSTTDPPFTPHTPAQHGSADFYITAAVWTGRVQVQESLQERRSPLRRG